MKECPQCGKTTILVEALGEGKRRLFCQSCSYQAIVDEQGRGLLTDNIPPKDPRHLITG